MSRIGLHTTFRDVLAALVEGNPGALSVCMALATESPNVDPDSALGGLAPLLSLDTHEIYGPSIWALSKNVCGGSIVAVLACLRAVQLGGLAGVTKTRLKGAIASGERLDTDAIIAAVRERLPRFAAPAPQVSS